MKKYLWLVAGMLLSPALLAQSTTYTFAGNVVVITNFTTPCGTGPCANFPPGTHITGQFTTSSPLPSGLPTGTNLLPQVVSYSFFDGLTTYTNTNPNARVYSFTSGTDGSGNIVNEDIQLEIWQTGSNPHVAGNRFALLNLLGPSDQAFNNAPCAAVGTGPAGMTDTCTSAPLDASTSQEVGSAPGVWSHAATAFASIPTLSNGALALLLLLLAGVAIRTFRGRRNA